MGPIYIHKLPINRPSGRYVKIYTYIYILHITYYILYNITSVWAVDREFVNIDWAELGPNFTQLGSNLIQIGSNCDPIGSHWPLLGQKWSLASLESKLWKLGPLEGDNFIVKIRRWAPFGKNTEKTLPNHIMCFSDES